MARKWLPGNRLCVLMLLLIFLLQQIRLPLLQTQGHLSEQPSRPAEPLSRPVTYVKSIDAFMNQPKAIRAAQDLTQNISDLGIVVTRQDLYDFGHWPSAIMLLERKRKRLIRKLTIPAHHAVRPRC